jgi:hypothetical protein
VAPAAAPAPGARARQDNAQAHGGSGGERCRQGRNNGAMSALAGADWWTVRPAANLKPSTYRCPICGHLLPALSEHMLIAPEGDSRRRRHAHSRCVLEARRRGELRLREDWLAAQPQRPSLWARLRGRG